MERSDQRMEQSGLERSGRNLYFLLHCMMPMVLPSLNQNHFFLSKKTPPLPE